MREEYFVHEIGDSPVRVSIGGPCLIDRKYVRKIKRGDKNISSTLDLHRMTSIEAFDEFKKFIYGCWVNNSGLVLVVTGRGTAGMGVIKNSMESWLNHYDIRRYILRASWAEPCHGGDGALYVLVRRKRS